MNSFNPLPMIKPKRKIRGMSAILLPFLEDGSIDWASLEAHVGRTADAGLAPAVNMDTGYGNLITNEEKRQVLAQTRIAANGREFVAGAFVLDQPGAKFQCDEYLQQMEMIQEYGGTPVIFQSYGLAHQPGPEVVASYQAIANRCDRFIGFELTQFLAPFGMIYDLPTFEGMLSIKQCIGAKHSSFQRQPEWDRLQLRDKVRPDFLLMTGNDFAIDMVMYGSDYLLGLSTFAPDLFALRDKYWETGDARFYELNDQLQYLGMFAFRTPGAAYKHNAAQFLHLRGWTATDKTHPRSPTRPPSDREVLREIGMRMGVLKS